MFARELALEAPKRFRFRSFLSLAEKQSLPVRTIRFERIHSIVYDTADRRLEALGASVRYRAFEGWTLSVPAGLEAQRNGRTIERTFAGSRDLPPAALLDALAAILCGEPLLARDELRAIRQRIRISGPDRNDAVAVAALDVRLVRGGKSKRSAQMLALKLLDPANAGLFADTARLLRDAGAKPVPEPARVRLPKGATAGKVVGYRLEAAFDDFCLAEVRLRLLHDVESVHDARVALRRVRGCLRSFSPMFVADWMRDTLGRAALLAEIFGAARDADVAVASVSAASERLDRRERGAARDVLARSLEARLQARRRLAAFMRTPRYLELVAELRVALSEPQFRPCAARPASELVPKLVTQGWKNLRREVKALGDAPADAALHAVRVRAKRCRYAAEAQTPFGGKHARRFVNKLGDLQDELGRIQDVVLELAWLGPYAQDPRTADAANAIGALAVADAAAAKRRWRRAWKAVRRSRRALA